MGLITWLASYPKSGNTWVRVFLTNYVRNGPTPADVNDLLGAPIASARQLFDELAGVEASELTRDEIARYRPEVYRHLARERDDALILMKVHDLYRFPTDTPLFPAQVTARVIYVVRNPMDVAVSLAHHQGVSCDVAVRRVCNGLTLSPGDRGLTDQLEQWVGSWSDHVRSWMDDSELPLHLVRFEDMVRDPLPTFEGIVAAAGLEHDADRVARAIEFSGFEQLRAQEKASGFRERSPAADVFFRHGRIGDWRGALSAEQVDLMLRTHGPLMTRLGYLAQSGDHVH